MSNWNEKRFPNQKTVSYLFVILQTKVDGCVFVRVSSKIYKTTRFTILKEAAVDLCKFSAILQRQFFFLTKFEGKGLTRSDYYNFQILHIQNEF